MFWGCISRENIIWGVHFFPQMYFSQMYFFNRIISRDICKQCIDRGNVEATKAWLHLHKYFPQMCHWKLPSCRWITVELGFPRNSIYCTWELEWCCNLCSLIRLAKYGRARTIHTDNFEIKSLRKNRRMWVMGKTGTWNSKSQKLLGIAMRMEDFC